jgi:starch synthase
MKILFVSSEVVPFAKTGGLADVAAALPKAIAKLGHDIRIFMPRYKRIDLNQWGAKKVVSGIEVMLDDRAETVDIYEAILPGSEVPVYFVDNRHFSNRDELYGIDFKDYPDNCEAFLTFCKAAISFLKEINWIPDIIHCNDWQAASITVYLREARKTEPVFGRTASVYSIHNMAYQGNFSKTKFRLMNLDDSFFDLDKLEAVDHLSFSKGGIVFADIVSTVSKTYAKEIQTEKFGYGLNEDVKKRSSDVFGVLNGIDYDLWNPAKDPALVKHYNRNTLSLRIKNKEPLQQEVGLPQNEGIPLIGMTSRLDVQKGIDLLVESIPQIVDLGCQIIILGTGDPKYHMILHELKQKYPDQIGLKLGFDADLAQRIYAGCDIFLMPSKYEPCGLGQLISFKYGTIPVVRKTGGLADTVHDYNFRTKEGDGFVFKEYSAEAFFETVENAVNLYKNRIEWKKLQMKVMDYDHSWNVSAKKYISLYMKALDKVI